MLDKLISSGISQWESGRIEKVVVTVVGVKDYANFAILFEWQFRVKEHSTILVGVCIFVVGALMIKAHEEFYFRSKECKRRR